MDLDEIIQKVQGRASRIQGAETEYAVLAPLVEQNGTLHLLFEVRSDTLSRQPGEVCFPGGRIEDAETPEDCALRETFEELGIPASEITVLAPLDKLVQPGGFLIHPILAKISPAGMVALNPGPDEVKETFLTPLFFFQNNPPLKYEYDLIPDIGEDFPYELIGCSKNYAWRRGRIEIPIYRWQGRPIWGLTGRIVERLMGVLA